MAPSAVHAARSRMLTELGVLERVFISLPLAAPPAGPSCHYHVTIVSQFALSRPRGEPSRVVEDERGLHGDGPGLDRHGQGLADPALPCGLSPRSGSQQGASPPVQLVSGQLERHLLGRSSGYLHSQATSVVYLHYPGHISGSWLHPCAVAGCQ